MEHFLDMGAFGGVFAVPNTVVDNYIKLANEASLKVLLYMLRNNGRQVGSAEIAKSLNITGSQVEEAFAFWENANVLFEKTEDNTQKAKNEIKTDSLKKIIPPSSEIRLRPSELADRIEGSEEMKDLFSMAEQSFGRLLNNNEQNGLVWMHDELGLSAEVILMITAYSLSVNKGNISYIKKVAVDWTERGITTLEQAGEEVKRLEQRNTYQGRLMHLFNMNRKLTSNEQKIAGEWLENGYGDELLEYAYERTVETINKLSFKYIDSILKDWGKKGVKTKEDAQTDHNIHTENSREHSFDLEDYKALVNDFGE